MELFPQRMPDTGEKHKIYCKLTSWPLTDLMAWGKSQLLSKASFLSLTETRRGHEGPSREKRKDKWCIHVGKELEPQKKEKGIKIKNCTSKFLSFGKAERVKERDSSTQENSLDKWLISMNLKTTQAEDHGRYLSWKQSLVCRLESDTGCQICPGWVEMEKAGKQNFTLLVL